MRDRRRSGYIARWVAGAAGFAAGGYATLVAAAWWRYGSPSRPRPEEADPLLDTFMPEYEVAERHSVPLPVPPEVALAKAAQIDLQRSVVIRAIFRMRELVLGAEDDASSGARPKGLVADITSLGWRMLAEAPGREMVFGAVTQPWLADVVFRGLAPAEFAGFCEPGHVKIAWTLRADPDGSGRSIFRTETRVVTTDPLARRKFRWYWARFSPGIVLIRRIMVGQLRRDAERTTR